LEQVKRIVLRMDPSLHAELTSTAKSHMRSFNSEVVHRLRSSLQISQSEIAETSEAYPEIAHSELLILSRFRNLDVSEQVAVISMLTNGTAPDTHGETE